MVLPSETFGNTRKGGPLATQVWSVTRITTCGLAEDAESQSHLRPVPPGHVCAPGGWRAAALYVNNVAILVCLILVKKLQLFKSRGI